MKNTENNIYSAENIISASEIPSYQIIERKEWFFNRSGEYNYKPRPVEKILAEADKKKWFAIFRSVKVTNVIVVGNNTKNYFTL